MLVSYLAFTRFVIMFLKSLRYVNNLAIGFWNIDGLYEGTGLNKTCKLDADEIKCTLSKFDIIGLVETHCGPNSPHALPGYRTFQNCRPLSTNKRHYGGISILIRNELKHGVKILPPSSSEIQWLKLTKSVFQFEGDIYLGIVYASPLNSTYSAKNEEDFLASLSLMLLSFQKRVGA